MESSNRLPMYLGGALVGLILLAGTAWFVAPFLQGEPELPVVTKAQPPQPHTKVGRPQAGNGPIVYGDPGDGGGGRHAKAAKSGKGKAGGGREERTAAFNKELDEYAQTAGWDAETTAEVRSVVMTTVEEARAAVAEAREAKDRKAAIEGLRQVRTKQAAALDEVLGEEAAKAFVTSIDFGSYFPRVAERRGAKAGGSPGPQ